MRFSILIRHPRVRLSGILLAALLGACSERQLYDSSQGLREQQCLRIANELERQHCLESATMSHDEYQRFKEIKSSKP
jgi:hypothetical protein